MYQDMTPAELEEVIAYYASFEGYARAMEYLASRNA
jgi:hypothetical protein